MKRRPSEDTSSPPAKLARQMRGLNLDETRTRPDLTDEPVDEMDDVEGANFTHIGRHELFNDMNEIHIDDRVLRIPDFIREPVREQTSEPQDQSRALILHPTVRAPGL